MTKIEYQEKAKELLEIIKHTTYGELHSSLGVSSQIYLIGSKRFADISWLMTSIFQAGKIEGIRKERARRKRLG